MTNIFKSIILTSFAIIFVVSTFVSIFNAGMVLNQAILYAIKALPERCDVKQPMSVDKNEIAQPECRPDVDATKRSVANGLSMLIVALPVAIFFWKQMRKAYNDNF